ncbi:MAG: glycoside hydrolase family 3 C-terminal domain-containing protein, partial [Clostridia bacterium]|nr:glycoside hydrolase family 3 C-terminal domain-containing protein [Clostridia bacterium]
TLPPNQLLLAERILSLGKEVVVVLASGHAPDVEFSRRCAAVLLMPLEVESSAEAAATLLSGDHSPSGRLAYTLYAGTEVAFRKRAFYRSEMGMKTGPFVGYRYYDTADMHVGYPFGHGLSYTYFHYSALTVRQDSVTFRIKNIGNQKGAEVAQVYIGLADSHCLRPKKELCGFEKVDLAPGETCTVTVPIAPPTVRVEGEDLPEKGTYTVFVGASVTDIRLRGRVTYRGASLPPHEERLSDYLQSVSNVTEGNYTLEAKYRPMKNTTKNILFGVGSLALAICIAAFNSSTATFSLFLGAVSGVLAACSLFFFIIEAVERSRAREVERKLIDVTNELFFREAEEVETPHTAALFREDFDIPEKPVEVEKKADDVLDDNASQYVDVDFRAAEAAEELKAFFAGRGYRFENDTHEAWLSAIATTRLIVVNDTPDDTFNPFIRLLSDYFGTETFVDDAVSGTSAFYHYDYHGDHTKKNILLALEYAKNNPTKVVIAALHGIKASDLADFITPFMRYLHTPKKENEIILRDQNGGAATYLIPANFWIVADLADGESIGDLPLSLLALASINRVDISICQPEDTVVGARDFNRYQLDYMLEKEAKRQAVTEEIFKKIDRLEKYTAEHSEYRIGNKQWLGLERHLGFMIATGVAPDEALDITLSMRLLPSVLVALKGNLTADDPSITETLDFIFGEDHVSFSKALLTAVFGSAEAEEESAEAPVEATAETPAETAAEAPAEAATTAADLAAEIEATLKASLETPVASP